MTLAAALKYAMEDKQITLTELARLTGLAKSSISQYLSGKNVPRPERMEAIATALSVPVEYLQGGGIEEPAEMPGNMTVADAARLLNKPAQFVRVALQKAAAPFGFAVQMPGGRWSYHISAKKLYEYMGG